MFNRLVQIAIAATLSAAAAGQLPRLLQSIQMAEFRILKDSESSKWGRPFLLPVQRERHTKPRIAR
jgi:hypothetical protein